MTTPLIPPSDLVPMWPDRGLPRLLRIHQNGRNWEKIGRRTDTVASVKTTRGCKQVWPIRLHTFWSAYIALRSTGWNEVHAVKMPENGGGERVLKDGRNDGREHETRDATESVDRVVTVTSAKAVPHPAQRLRFDFSRPCVLNRSCQNQRFPSRSKQSKPCKWPSIQSELSRSSTYVVCEKVSFGRVSRSPSQSAAKPDHLTKADAYSAGHVSLLGGEHLDEIRGPPVIHRGRGDRRYHCCIRISRRRRLAVYWRTLKKTRIEKWRREALVRGWQFLLRACLSSFVFCRPAEGAASRLRRPPVLESARSATSAQASPLPSGPGAWSVCITGWACCILCPEGVCTQGAQL